jgi:hypothetical protein
MRSAENLADWCHWCEAQDAKLRDGSIDIHSLFRDMFIPVGTALEHGSRQGAAFPQMRPVVARMSTTHPT